MNPPDEFTWKQITALGVKLAGPAEYARTVEKGVESAKSVADGFTSGPWVDAGQVTTLHWAAYKDVYPWAGQFRRTPLVRGEESWSEPGLIRSDLKTLNNRSRDWFQSEDVNVIAKEMAAYNAAFYKIHPFLEGNYIVGTLLLEHQAREIFGRKIHIRSDELVYRAALETALKGNFSPLAKQIIEHCGLSRVAESHAVSKLMSEASQQLKEKEKEKGMEQSW